MLRSNYVEFTTLAGEPSNQQTGNLGPVNSIRLDQYYAAVSAMESAQEQQCTCYIVVCATECPAAPSYTTFMAVSVVFLQRSSSFRVSCQVSIALSAMDISWSCSTLS